MDENASHEPDGSGENHRALAGLLAAASRWPVVDLGGLLARDDDLTGDARFDASGNRVAAERILAAVEEWLPR